MDIIKSFKALGLVSGTGLRGVDVALITTDGVDVYDISHTQTVPYDDELREDLIKIQGLRPDNETDAQKIQNVEKKLTEFYAEIVKEFLEYNTNEVDIIGLYGYALIHEPENHYCLQLGDGDLLAKLTGIKVVNNFSKADIFAGGQGAPLLPAYHMALTSSMIKPIAVVNIGGVSSLTWLGENGEIIAFDTGPGNSIIDDWCFKKAGQHMDYNGKLAITGTINEKIVNTLMHHKYFAIYPPKAVNRNTFKDKLEHLEGLSLEDGAATATAFVAESIAYAIGFYLPLQPKEIILCGGGAKNPTLVRFIRQRLNNIEVKTGTDVDWEVDTVEAQGFAYLAVRRIYEIPSTFPTTTGAFQPIICGEIHEP